MDGKTTFISRGSEIAFSRGMMVVISAGNEGNTSNPHVAAPADAVSVLTIGAVNSSKVRVGFSSIGPSFDNRIKPDVMAQGLAAAVSNQTGGITTANGTSFSSPILAGMVACLWQALPNKTNKEIRQIIIQSGDRFSSPDNQYGYGTPNFSTALNRGLSTKDFSESYFYMYPNPTTDFVTFPESFNSGKIIFYTVLGQKVLEKNISGEPHFISLQSLRSGLYLYTFEVDATFKSGKILKY
jgi:subtilisin family serine protease